MDCSKCGYVLEPWDEECPRCKRLGEKAVTHFIEPASVSPRPPSAGTLICAMPITEAVAPVVPPNISAAGIPFTLSDLHAAEQVAWKVRGEKTSVPQFMALLKYEGLDIRSHQAFSAVFKCPNHDEHAGCDPIYSGSHDRHKTDEQQRNCTEKQAERMAAKTILHAIGLLYRLDEWSKPGSLATHAMWAPSFSGLCTDLSCGELLRTQAVITTNSKAIVLRHPGCRCGLKQLHPDLVNDSITRYGYLQKYRPLI